MLTPAAQIRPHRDQHVGSRHADQPHVVAEDLVLAPLLERLVDAERVAEVDGAAEHLLGAVEAVRGAQLLAAQHAKRLEQLGADLVLPAVAPVAVARITRSPCPWLCLAINELFSSSGCAVTCMTVPVTASLRSINCRPTRPRSSVTGPAEGVR